MHHRTWALCAIAFFFSANQMYADLVVVNDPQYGPSSIVQDTATGLEWLNLSLTANLSYDTVSSNFSQGGMFQGFHYASLSEIVTFFTDANIPVIGLYNAANLIPVTKLLQEIGILGAFPGDYSKAINAQSVTPGTHEYSSLYAFPLPPSGAWAIPDYGSVSDSSAPGTAFGSFIIRQTAAVPEPRALPILAVCLTGLIVVARCRHVTAKHTASE